MIVMSLLINAFNWLPVSNN